MSLPLRIAIVGYGKMGRRIDAIAQSRGHEVVARLGRTDDLQQIADLELSAVIEFTSPDSAMHNFEKLLNMDLPVVTGTTGWLNEQDRICQLTENQNGSFLWGSNFSIGVNLMFQMNRRLAELMNRFPQYDPFVEERHHRYKKDSPSGTARTIAEDIVVGLDRKSSFVLSDAYSNRAPSEEQLTVGVVRAGEVPGTHTVVYNSEVDQITLQHQAFGRDGFALGAVIAAEWLIGKRGFFAFHELFERGEL